RGGGAVARGAPVARERPGAAQRDGAGGDRGAGGVDRAVAPAAVPPGAARGWRADHPDPGGHDVCRSRAGSDPRNPRTRGGQQSRSRAAARTGCENDPQQAEALRPEGAGEVKVGTKLAGAFGLQVAILVGVLYYHVGVIRDSVETSYELSGISERVFVFSTEQLVRIDQLEEYASKYVVTQDAGYLEKFHQVAAEFEQVLRTVADEELGGRERAELARLEASWAAFRETVATLPVLPRGIPPAAAEAAWAPLREHLDRLEADTRSAGDAFQAAMVASLEGSAAAARAAERISWTAAGIALLTSVLISALIVRYISDSLNRLKQGTREVASGNFAYRLDTRRSDEFAQVARDFNTMTELLAELDRMKRDFVSKVSHDLKTPLASMLETVNILLDEVPGPLTEKQRRLLVLNEQSGRRLSSMIAKLLDLSRLEAGALEPE